MLHHSIIFYLLSLTEEIFFNFLLFDLEIQISYEVKNVVKKLAVTTMKRADEDNHCFCKTCVINWQICNLCYKL